MNHKDRKDPETLIGRVPETKKGHLKVYLGGAAGVGKTYRMLEEAHQLREQGHDVVLGFVETHAAILFAREGARLLLIDRQIESAEETAAMIVKEGGIAKCFAGDWTDAASCKAYARACIDE